MLLLEDFLSQDRQEYTRMRLGLQRMQAALEMLGHPESSFASVIIAGTNGKGSVARMLEAVLVSANHRVGLYTSPHLSRFCERIRLQGKEVTEETLLAVLTDFQQRGFLDHKGNWVISSGERLTWFEKTTVLALEVFHRQGVKLAILEIGLGGRMDAVNAVEPLISAITSIGLDHTEVLGNSIELIAREKAGVMRSGKPIVLGLMDAEILKILQTEAQRCGALPVLASTPVGSRSDFSYGNHSHLALNLLGSHQLKNASVALEILQDKGFGCSEAALRRGLSQVTHPGRLEWMSSSPAILLDGAHNIDAFQTLADYLRENCAGKPLTIVLGMMAEKDPVTALRILREFQPHFLFTEVQSPRSLKISHWQALCESEKISGEFFIDSIQALKKAQRLTPNHGLVLVTGSLYLVGEVRNSLI